MKIAIKLRAVFVCLSLFCSLPGFGLSQEGQVIASDEQCVTETKKSLKGNVQETDTVGITKETENYNDTNLRPDKAQTNFESQGKKYLKGSAQLGDLEPANEDPDADDKELMIAWDRWRNRFLQAVLGSTTEMLNNDQARSFQINRYTHATEPLYPVGTAAWFVCEVTRDRQIKRLRILDSSGYPQYDQSVLEAVQALQGSSILKFPTGSRRKAVLQGGAIERANQSQQQYFHFGDIERYHVPAY